MFETQSILYNSKSRQKIEHVECRLVCQMKAPRLHSKDPQSNATAGSIFFFHSDIEICHSN